MRKANAKLKIIIAAAASVLALTACGADNGETVADSDEAVTLDWYVNYSWYATPWGENAVSRAITEKTGVDINFITPIGNESEKLNALMASDTLPDLITLGFWEPQIDEMIENDMIYPLNELADEYEPYFWEVADNTVVNWYTRDDGNIYEYPNSAVSPQDLEENKTIGSNQTFLVRKDIYEAIGSPDMSTTQGFKAAVEKAYEMFPLVDEKPLIPVGAHVFDNEGNPSFDKYLMNFLAIPWEKNGTLYDRYTDPEYIKWLKMFRELGEEGLLSTDIFVDTRTQSEEKIAEGRYFCMIYQYTDMLTQQKQIYSESPERIYMAVEGPRNSNGDDPTLPSQSVSGWTVTLISKNCKSPEKAIKFMSYLMSEEGQMCLYMGVEGVTYDMIDGVPVLKPEVKALLDSNREEYDKLYGADDAYWQLQDNVMQQKWIQTASPAEEQLMEWSRKYVVYNGQYELYLPSGADGAEEDKKIRLLWSRTLPQLLLAPSEKEFDDIFADFTAQRKALGFKKVQQAGSEYMNAAKKKLGISK